MGHGGDPKLHSLDEPTYLDFAERWAACQWRAPGLGWGLQPGGVNPAQVASMVSMVSTSTDA